MNDIVVCVDFSDASSAVIDAAAALADEQHGRLHLVHVAAAEPELAGYDQGPVAAHTRDDRAGELLAEHQHLRELAGRLEARGVPVVPLVLMGPTVSTILAEADRLDATAIVTGSHGHGRLHHLLLGSVSEGLLHHSKRPVVVVPVAER
jgi:nucleotide-binding universal stress UspA family protein